MIGLLMSLVIQGTILMIRLTIVAMRLAIAGMVLLYNVIVSSIESRR